MGKTRTKRGRGLHKTTNGNADGGEDLVAQGAGDARADTISNIVEQLKSVSAEERLCGCLTFSQLVSGELTLRALRTHRLVRLVGPLLVDPCVGTRQAAAGALRNLSLSAGKEGCDLMLEQDVLTSLMTTFGKYSDGWKPQRKTEKGQVLLDAESEIFVQLTNLLWNLCEASDKAVTVFNKSRVCHTLLRCLDLSVYPSEVVVAVGQCLHALSEDNPVVATLVRQQLPLVHALVAADGDGGDRVLLRVLALGILMNVCADDSGPGPGQVITLISRTLGPDVRDLACKVTSSTEADDYELQLADLCLLLTAQQVALELLTDFSGGDDSSDGWTAQDSVEQSDELEDAEEELTQDMEDTEWQDGGDPSPLPTEVHEAIVGQGLLQRVLSKADGLPTNVADILNETNAGQQLCRRFLVMRCRVFLCLNNLISALELSELGGDAELVVLWRNMGRLVLPQDAGDDTALLEAAGSAMRAALQKLLDAGRPGPSDVSVADLELMTSRAASCADASARASLVRGVGLLGCLRVKGRELLPPADVELVQAIGRFLTELAVSDADLLVVAEALDALMDLYGEDCTDQAASNIQLVSKLRAVQSGLKAKVSVQRHRAAQHYPLVATVRTNLPRFIKYKAARVAVQMNGNGVH